MKLTPLGNLALPCNECPFRKIAMSGWLGPWKPRELVDSLQMTPFPCHKTIPFGEDGIPFSDPRLKGCAGAAIFLNNKCELSRAMETSTHQFELIGIPQEEKDKVFGNAEEFVDYHKVRMLK